LLGNAAKFTEKGEIEINLKLESEEDQRITINTTIRDTGIGIPADKLALIFEPFQQVDGSITRRYGGTGLGLSICKKIAEKMNGNIWIESPAPQSSYTDTPGSTFHLLTTFKKPEKSTVKSFKAFSLARKKVLVIDNIETNLKLLERMLSPFGLKTTLLRKGEDALSALKQANDSNEPFDLCICEIQMPDFSGYDVATSIRQSGEEFAMIPMVALTSAVGRDTKKCSQHGFNGFLTKPIFKHKLIRMLENILGEVEEDNDNLKTGPTSKIHTQYTVMESLKQSAHILLVEDNKVNQKLAKLMLKKAGYKVDVANNGFEAVQKFQDTMGKLDLIFMDIQMPEINGYEATKEIRKLEKEHENSQSPYRNSEARLLDHVPIIAMTAHAMKGDKETCLEAGMDDYVSKPIDRNKVFEILQKYIFKA
jgi:CheY-like chemotaxis protein